MICKMPEPLPTFDEVQAAAGKPEIPIWRAAVALAARGERGSQSGVGNGFFALPRPGFILRDRFPPDFATRYFRSGGAPGRCTAWVIQPPPPCSFRSGTGEQIAALVKQANLRREQAHVELTFAQRRLLANLRTLYDEGPNRKVRNSNRLASQPSSPPIACA